MLAWRERSCICLDMSSRIRYPRFISTFISGLLTPRAPLTPLFLPNSGPKTPRCPVFVCVYIKYQISSTGANETRGAAIKSQLNTEIAACDKKQKEKEHKHKNTPTMNGGAVQLAYSAGASTAAVRVPCDALRSKCERISCFF